MQNLSKSIFAARFYIDIIVDVLKMDEVTKRKGKISKFKKYIRIYEAGKNALLLLQTAKLVNKKGGFVNSNKTEDNFKKVAIQFYYKYC